MRKYIIQRFLQLIPILIGITFLSFAMMRVAGSDAVTELYTNRGTEVSQEIIDARRAELGLDKPFLIQYFSWLGGMLTGDMGQSYVSGADVFSTFLSKLPATLLLTGLSIALTVIISIPLGFFSAMKQDRIPDLLLRFCSFIGNALPNFFVAMLFIAPVFAGGANAFFAARTGEEWQLSALCFIAISLGFNVPSLIYENERLALWLRTLIHMVIGTAVYLLTAYFAGWMESDIGSVAQGLLIALGAAAVIWLCIFLYIKAQVRKMNRKIKEKQQNG